MSKEKMGRLRDLAMVVEIQLLLRPWLVYKRASSAHTKVIRADNEKELERAFKKYTFPNYRPSPMFAGHDDIPGPGAAGGASDMKDFPSRGSPIEEPFAPFNDNGSADNISSAQADPFGGAQNNTWSAFPDDGPETVKIIKLGEKTH